MDPMTDLVRARTADLQRTADAIRRERTARETAGPDTTQALLVPSGEGVTLAFVAPVDAATGCDGAGCLPATDRHAA